MRPALVLLALGFAGCLEAPTPPPVRVGHEASPAEPAAPEPAAAGPANAVAAAPTTALSKEDERLIAADPKDLSPEDRRKRAYAIRRKIMQNPDSPTARALTDMQEAVRSGQVDPKHQYPTLSLPGSKPQAGAPPAGYRPDPDGGAAPSEPAVAQPQ